jgi:dinuclear metal center YbgI/SA1388 family protein
LHLIYEDTNIFSFVWFYCVVHYLISHTLAMVLIKDVIQFLETIAPPSYQEGYDNAGLIIGDAQAAVNGVLCCLDSTEAILDEAIEKGCNLVVAHHPIVFKGLKRFTGKTYPERVVIKAIKHDIAIYAIHTNLDNVYQHGVNAKIADLWGLQNTRILVPKPNLKCGIAYGATEDQQNLYRLAGAYRITYIPGVGLECVFPAATASVLANTALSTGAQWGSVHAVEDPDHRVGSGMIGDLPEAMPAASFLQLVKKIMRAGVIRHTALPDTPVQRIALCGGAGGALLPAAIAQAAEVYVTADYKYHEFFDAEGKIVIADIGHFEIEQFTSDLLQELISNKFRTFAAYCSEVSSNPVSYL